MVSLFFNFLLMTDTINPMSLDNTELKKHLEEVCKITVKEGATRAEMIKLYSKWKKEKGDDSADTKDQEKEKAEKPKAEKAKKTYKVLSSIRRNGVQYEKGDEIEGYDGIEEELGHALEL